MNQSVCGREATERFSPLDRRVKAMAPPVSVERDTGVAVDESERDLRRRTPERRPDWLAALILDSHGARGRRRPATYVASIHPRMAMLPTPRALGRDDGEIIVRS
jgi:hypothetical protein